jgi:SPP1 family predicted phage head-tail adaptor
MAEQNRMTFSTRIAAGKLRQKIDILQPTGVQDSAGGISLADYTVLATVWASIEPTGGTETLAAGSETSVVTHRIEIRYIAGLNASMQVGFSGRKFQITAVENPDERTKKLYLQVVELNDSRQQ